MNYVKLLNENVAFNAPTIPFSVTGKEVKELSNPASKNQQVKDALKGSGPLTNATQAEFIAAGGKV